MITDVGGAVMTAIITLTGPTAEFSGDLVKKQFKKKKNTGRITRKKRFRIFYFSFFYRTRRVSPAAGTSSSSSSSNRAIGFDFRRIASKFSVIVIIYFLLFFFSVFYPSMYTARGFVERTM